MAEVIAEVLTKSQQDDLKRKQADLKLKIQAIESALHVFNSCGERHRRSKDPVIRATLLVDKLSTIVDIAMGVLLSQNADLSDDLKVRIKSTSQMVSGELDFLMDWISSPVYSPDHPFGNTMMKGSEKNFSEISVKTEHKI